MIQQFYRMKDITKLFNMSHWTVARMIENREFPKPIQFSERSLRWSVVEIEKWMQQRLDAAP